MTEDKKNNGQTVTVTSQARNSLIILSAATILTLYLHTALAPALPDIIQSFNISFDLASWVLTAYMVAGAVMSIVLIFRK
jgi:MFS family permease